jgi:uncharacterized protein YwqG
MDWGRLLGRGREAGSGPTWAHPPADRADFGRRLDAVGLGAHREPLVALARESARLVPVDSGAPPGTTRLGGQPDLPVGTAWPRHMGEPLSFLLQVDLAEVRPHLTDADLPGTGLLSFFYDAVTQETWGFDPDDRGSWAVLHSPADGGWEPRAFPDDLPEEGRFQPVLLAAAPETTFPPWESHDVSALGMDDSDYASVLGEGEDDEEEPHHRVLGHPDPIQGDMQTQCQLASNGVFCGDAAGYRGARSRTLQRDAGRWRLLAQVDSSEDETGMAFGDEGRVYFWITENDLQAQRWEGVWTVVQCY